MGKENDTRGKGFLDGLKNAAASFGAREGADAPRHTVATPSKAARDGDMPDEPAQESRVGDVLDTARMPKPKPASVSFGEIDDFYGDDAPGGTERGEFDGEREFAPGYTGGSDETVRDVLRRYLRNGWVRAGLAAFGILLAMYFSMQIYLKADSHVRTERANITVYSETIDVEGVAIRDETPIGASVSGAAVSAVRNGEKVLKGQPVINVFHSAEAAESYERIAELERQIARLMSLSTAYEDSADAVRNIENMLDEQMAQLSDIDGSGNLSGVADVKEEVSYLLSKRLVAMRRVENYQERVDALTREKETLEATYSQAPSTVNAPASGYYVSALDGYESLLDTSMLADMTAESLEDIMTKDVTAPDSGCGKLLKDFTWYLACPVPVKEAEDYLTVGSTYTLLLPYSKTGSMKATLAYLNANKDDPNSTKVLAIFRCTSLAAELCDLRTQPVKIQIRSYKGFNIKKNALHVKVSEREETDEDGNLLYEYEDRRSCVYVKVGNQIYAKRINILYNGENFVICGVSDQQDSSYLARYDEVITEGMNLYEGKIVD